MRNELCILMNPIHEKNLYQLVQPKIVELMRNLTVRWNTELQQNRLAVSDLEFFGSVVKLHAQRFWDTHTKPSAFIHRDVISQSLANTMIPSSSRASFQFHSPSKFSTSFQTLQAGVPVENENAGWRSKRPAFQTLVQ